MRVITAVGVCVLLLGGPLQALAQNAPVEIVLRLSQGEVLYHSYVSTESNYFAIGTPTTIPSRREEREAVRVLDVADDGTMLIETVDEDRRVTVDGTPVPSTPAPTMMRVRRDGSVAETLWGTPQRFYPTKLPGRPVSVGATWTDERDYVQGTVKARGTDTFTLSGIEQTADGRVARIRVQGQGSVTDTAVPIRVPQGWRVTSRGTARVSGEYVWSLDRGRLISSSEDIFFDLAVYITTPDGNATGSWTIRTSARRTLVLAASVSARAIDSAKIIAPGKSIGSYTMDMTVSQLTSQLGAGAATMGDAGLRVLAVRWPPGLVGFYERENQDRLVGLQIADVTYRTEKGIGFRSTQGEVILAYGKPSAEVTLAIPKNAVRMIVYDEIGLAFAIAADKERTVTDQLFHAPIGAVDWTDVFPPGTAAKIYPLP